MTRRSIKLSLTNLYQEGGGGVFPKLFSGPWLEIRRLEMLKDLDLSDTAREICNVGAP